jgi:transcriptional regulator with PAS, ATPase and Fis domain
VQANLAEIYKFQGDWQTCRNYLKSSLSYSKEQKSATSAGIDYYNIAELEYLKHNETGAREYLYKAAEIFKKKKDVDHITACELLKLKLDFLFPPKGPDNKKRKLDVKGLQRYRKFLSPDQQVFLSIFYILKSGTVPAHKQSLVIERINRVKSARLRFEIISLLFFASEMPGLIELLKDLSRQLSKKSRNYYYYEYYYIYFDTFHDPLGIDRLNHLPEDHDIPGRKEDIFMEMYYFFSRNKRRLSYRIKMLKDRLDEWDSVYDVFKSAELVGDYIHWKVPGDFFNSLVKELKKIAPVELVKLVIYKADNPVFDFTTDTLFEELTGEMVAGVVRRLENVKHTLEDVKRLYNSHEKAFYPYRDTRGLLWKISGTLSGVLLLGFQSRNYYDHDFTERGRKLLKTFASLIDTYYEKDYRLNEKLGRIIGESPAMKKLKQQILKVGKVPFSLLIRGESGSGKELVARGVHLLSSRSGKPFIPVNAAAIPENLLEAELFGYKKGAFTGAVTGKIGLIEAAHGGTLFLDEIADLPLSLQAKMLRVLQENEIRRLGETHTVTVDFRLISATNKDLKKMMEENRFREDFYFRLQDLTIDVPPLKERIEDIPLLARHFLEKYKFPLEDESEFRRIVDYLKYHPWPGNVRELESCVKRLITYYPDFDMDMGVDYKAQSGLIAARENLEREMVHNALTDYNWNKLRAAEALRISRQHLMTLVEKYRLEKE